MPEAVPEWTGEEELPTDATEILNPPEHVCPACGEEIVRQEGQKGRLPKYHPECKPARSTRQQSGTRAVRVTSKDRAIAEQIEQILERAERQIAKAVMLLSLADPFDALVLRVNTPDLIEHLRVLLWKFPRLRETSNDVTVVSSIIGLAITVLSIGLPIAAHHKLIPSAKLSQIFMAIPMFMMRMQENMENGGNFTDVLIQRVMEEEEKKRREHLRTQGAETVNASSR